MSERRWQQSIPKRKAIEDSIIASEPIPGETEIDIELGLPGQSLENLNEYLEGENYTLNNEAIDEVRETKNRIERLEKLRNMDIVSAVEAVKKIDPEGYARELMPRIEFYANLAAGKAMQTLENWDGSIEEVPIEGADRESISLGLLRDVLWTAMRGTPERGVFILANKTIEEKGLSDVHMILVKGYHSGIDFGEHGTLDHSYRKLSKIYNEALQRVRRRRDVKDIAPEQIEHKAVRLASDWLAEAMDYNDPNRGPESPYVGSLDEAIAWARLEGPAKWQFQGMRRKIMEVDLHNIKRFIGKSGENKFHVQARRLKRELEYFNSASDKLGLTAEYNQREIEYLQNDHEKDRQELIRRHEKAKQEILEADFLSDGEREDQINQLEDRYAQELDMLEQDFTRESSRIASRNVEQVESDLKVKLEEVNEKARENASLAEKAIFLHFKLRDFENSDYNTIDWINDAPFGLINWTYNALRRGVSPDTAFGYARAAYLFPEATISKNIIRLAQTIDTDLIRNIREIGKINQQLGIESDPETSLALASYRPEMYKALINKGYPIEALAKYSWLGSQEIVDCEELFPYDGRPKFQQGWLARHAVTTPEGWNRKRIGKIMFTRLNAGLDDSLHDASYWFSEFNPPESRNGELLRNESLEIAFLHTLRNVPEDVAGLPDDTKGRRKALKKYRRYEDLFSSEGARVVFRAILNIYEQGGYDNQISPEQLSEVAEKMLVETQRKIGDSPTIAGEVERVLAAMHKDFEAGSEIKPVSFRVGELRPIAKRRNDFINEAQLWVENHGTTARDVLVTAWKNRDAALADGCADNPYAIKQWAELNSLRNAFEEMERRNELPANISREDLMQYRNWFSEMVRHYDGRTAIETLARLKREFNPDCNIPPIRIDMGNGWVGEILAKNDPRGTTIGPDTGCCMTLSGESSSCIRAGYSKAPYGFFALYREGKLVAQSFIYTNLNERPDVIVCDNIEVNKGREVANFIERYQDFFKRYLAQMLRRHPDSDFSQVNVGTGYTDVNLSSLDPVDSLAMPDTGIYTDAKNQRLLLQISEKEKAKLKQFSTERMDTGTKWEDISKMILAIEKDAFRDKGYSESQLSAEFSDPNNICVLLRDGDKIVGYVSALAQEDGETLYVSSTALLRDYQGQGLVSDMMRLLDTQAREQGYRFYERHARVDNGYAAKLKRNYTILKEGAIQDTPHGKQQFLRMEIPDHRLPTALVATEEVKHVEPGIDMIRLDRPEQLAIISELEQTIYPEGMQTGRDFFEEALSETTEEDNASLILMENNTPVGYVFAGVAESDVDGRTVLEIADMAILPECQGKGYGKQLLGRMVKFAEARQGMPIEFQARKSTSYAVLMHLKDEIASGLDYGVTMDRPLGKYWEEYGSNEEAQLVRLEKITPIEEKKIA